MDRVKELIEMCKDMESKNILEGNPVHMKILAIDTDGETNMVVMADWEPKSFQDRDTKLMALGYKISQITKKLDKLMLVSDTYFAKLDLKGPISPAEQIIYNDMVSGKRRLEHLPPELHKYRGEALMIVLSENKGKKVSLTFVPHTVEDGKVVFQKEDTSPKANEDNMLPNVWQGYALGMIGGKV